MSVLCFRLKTLSYAGSRRACHTFYTKSYMAERNEKIFERVRQELGKNANLGSRELYEIAKKVDPSLQDSLQQFHARYVLPVRRARSAGGAPAAKGGRAQKSKRATAASKSTTSTRGARARRATTARDNARAVLLRFAQDFSAAETKSEIVKVMSRLDEYVDQLSANGR